MTYNAAHALCLAALRHAGFRSHNRHVVFQALPHTLGLGPEVWRVLAKCHEIRNRGEYEGDLNVEERLVKDLVIAFKAVARAVDERACAGDAVAGARFQPNDCATWARARRTRPAGIRDVESRERSRRKLRPVEHGVARA